MNIRITSWRGDHQAVLENEVAEAIFDKLTGKTAKALPSEMKVKVPDNFGELEALWNDGKMGYMAVAKEGEDTVMVKDFDPKAETLVFLAPIIGG